MTSVTFYGTINKVSPRGQRDDMPLADGSSTVAYRFAANQKSRRTYVRPRTGPQSARLVAGGD